MQSTIPHDAAADISPDDEKIGQLRVPDDEDFTVDRVKSLGNGTVSSLMNDIVLPGYADHTIRRLGLGPYPGLHTTIKLAMGLYVKPTITAMCDIADAVLKRLGFQQSSKLSIRLWFLAEREFKTEWWHALQNIDVYSRPYAEMLAEARKNSYTDLTYNNFVLEDLEHPENPVSSADIFVDAEQQTVSILGGAVEEIAMRDELAAKLWKMSLQAVAIKDPYSLWEPQDNDMQMYGIRVDKQPLRWYFIVDLSNGVADVFPDVDVPFNIYIRLPCTARRIPNVALSIEQLNSIKSALLKNLRLAETKRVMAERQTQAQLDKAIQDNREGKQERLEKKLETIKDQVCHSKEAAVEHRAKPVDVQLAATARQFATSLRQQDGEWDIEWGDRIHDWVRANGQGREQNKPTGYGESFRTIRRQLPPGYSANVALGEVRNAIQSNWPIGLKKPPVKIDVPSITIKGTAGSFLADVWQPDKEKAAKTAYTAVSFKAWFTPNDTSIKAECAAVTAMHELSEVPAKRFWDYTQRFRETKELHNWLKQYPALDRQVSERHHSGERYNFLRSLENVPFGVAAITGGPGSGKSTLAEDVILAVISELSVTPVYERDVKPEDAAKQEDWNASLTRKPCHPLNVRLGRLA
ncbi:hypothetical protein HYE68_009751 [Fusarium pseudograminearum]|nr:hypothetical protein HYE68_009751 [Fusarium pseudograminearum]